MKLNLKVAMAAATVASLIGCAAPNGPPPPDGLVSAEAKSATWTWRINVYDAESGTPMPPGRLELSGKPGEYRIRYVMQTAASCFQASLPAMVSEDDNRTIITTTPRMKGCAVARYVIRKDGSGGKVETKVGDAWVPSPRENGLTPL